MKKILSLEGGGCRGIIILSMMRELFGDNFKPKKEYDLIAGTSVGALLTGLFVKGYTVGESIKLFGEWLPKIFDRNYMPWKTKYSDEGVIEFFDKVIGDDLFDNYPEINFIITTYSTSRDKGTYFKSSKCDHKCIKLADAMKASMAAPYYFPEFKMDLPGNRYDDIYVDGGLTGNNDPSGVAFAEAIRYLGWKNEKIRMDSFGCGKFNKVNDPGFPGFILNKLLRVMDALFKSATDNVEQTMNAICDIMPDFSYIRYNPDLPEDYALDDINRVKEMYQVGKNYIRSRNIKNHKF